MSSTFTAPSTSTLSTAEVTRARFDANGSTPEAVRDALSQAAEAVEIVAGSAAYGECVLERNLVASSGAPDSWKGRLTIHPPIGSE